MDIGILNMIMLSVFPFLIGAAMRYGMRKQENVSQPLAYIVLLLVFVSNLRSYGLVQTILFTIIVAAFLALGAAIEYAIYNQIKPLHMTVYCIIIVIVGSMVRAYPLFSGNHLSSREFTIYMLLAVFLILGALAMDLILRIRKKH